MAIDAIKTKRDINLINGYFCANYSKMSQLFKFGMNTALRISDILALKWDDIETNTLIIKEIKTGKKRPITLNTGALLALSELKAINDRAIYLFQSEGNRAKGVEKPYHYNYVYRAFNEASYINGLSMPYKLGTHTMRKTFGYHQYKYNNASLAHLMSVFGHSSEAITLRYIGITSEDIAETYNSMVL